MQTQNCEGVIGDKQQTLTHYVIYFISYSLLFELANTEVPSLLQTREIGEDNLLPTDLFKRKSCQYSLVSYTATELKISVKIIIKREHTSQISYQKLLVFTNKAFFL